MYNSANAARQSCIWHNWSLQEDRFLYFLKSSKEKKSTEKSILNKSSRKWGSDLLSACNPCCFASVSFLEPDQELDFSVAGASLAPVVQLLEESDFGTYLDTFLISVQTLWSSLISINAMIHPGWILVEGYDTTWFNFRISPAGKTDFLWDLWSFLLLTGLRVEQE